MGRRKAAGLSERQKEIILAMADNDMRVLRAARAMYCCNSGLYGHFERIKEQTGLDPMKFYDLVKLVEMVKGATT